MSLLWNSPGFGSSQQDRESKANISYWVYTQQRWEDNLRRAILPSLQDWVCLCVPRTRLIVLAWAGFWWGFLGHLYPQALWALQQSSELSQALGQGYCLFLSNEGLLVLFLKCLWSSWGWTGRWLLWAPGHNSLPWNFDKGTKPFISLLCMTLPSLAIPRYPGLTQRCPSVGVGLTLVPPWKAGIAICRQSLERAGCVVYCLKEDREACC